MVNTIIGAIAANTIVLAALAFLTRSIVLHFLAKDVEQFKINLETKANIGIESYRSKLEKEHIRLQISYSGIFEKQANVIIEIYRLILDFEDKIRYFMTPLDDPEKAYKDFIQSHNILFNYYEKNRILLPKSFEESFESFLKKMYKAITTQKNVKEDFKRREMLERLNMLEKDDIDRLYKKQDNAYEIIDNLPQFKNNLTEKLRALIGLGVE